MIRRKSKTPLYNMLGIYVAVCFVAAMLTWFIRQQNDVFYYDIFSGIIIAILFLSIAYVLTMLVFFVKLDRSRLLSKRELRFMRKSLHHLYPVGVAVSKYLKITKQELRRHYISLNNQLLDMESIRVEKRKMMVLTPHCLQFSGCKVKVTIDPHNCTRCGICDVDKLLALEEAYGIKLVIATGGTLARKAVMEHKPDLIFAVACERDLASGIYDMRQKMVYGVLNDRPNGPCIDTSVQIPILLSAIERFAIESESRTKDECKY